MVNLKLQFPFLLLALILALAGLGFFIAGLEFNALYLLASAVCWAAAYWVFKITPV